jgi:hypothetical protein
LALLLLLHQLLLVLHREEHRVFLRWWHRDASMDWRFEVEQLGPVTHLLVAQLHVAHRALEETPFDAHTRGDLGCEGQFGLSRFLFLLFPLRGATEVPLAPFLLLFRPPRRSVELWSERALGVLQALLACQFFGALLEVLLATLLELATQLLLAAFFRLFVVIQHGFEREQGRVELGLAVGVVFLLLDVLFEPFAELRHVALFAIE